MSVTSDRMRETLEKIVRALLPELTFFGVYEYAVQATDGNASTPSKTVDANPTATTTSGGRKLSLPNVTKVPIMLPYGVTPPVGALCSVQFMNGDPARPVVVGFNDPMTLMVFAGGTLANARQGDMIAVTIANPASPTLNATMLAFAAQFVNAGGPCVWTPAGPPLTLYGLVTSGTPQVKS